MRSRHRRRAGLPCGARGILRCARPGAARSKLAARVNVMTLHINGALVLAGVGNMGLALLSGWLERGLDPARVIVQDPAPPLRAKELLERHAIVAHAFLASLPEPPAVLVLAVKPQIVDEVVPPLARLAGSNSVVLSIAAGRTI